MNKKHFIQVLSLIYLITCAGNSIFAQQFLQYWGNPDAMLQDQASLVIEQSYKILEKYPPSTQASDERKLALYALDVLMHDTRLDNTPVFGAYMNRMASHVLEQLQKEKPVDSETRLYRFYNHGFIVQTSTVTIGIDLVRGGRRNAPVIDDSLMRAIVNQCNMFFISHAHGDHADSTVIRMFWENGKNVIVPPELLIGSLPNLITLRGEKQISQTFRSAQSNALLNVSVYSGHQGSMPNNLYVITLPNGHTIMHTGDQDNPEDLELISNIGNDVKVDILLAHCWIRPVEKIIEGVRPSLVICGHENEMEHTIDHREAYWMTFHRMANIGTPSIVMAWGESYRYRFEQ